MNTSLRFDDRLSRSFFTADEYAQQELLARAAKKTLEEGLGQGNDFLGWLDLPVNYDREEYARVLRCAEKIRSDSQVLLVIGIGGSYLGAKAAIDFMAHCQSTGMHASGRDKKTPEICFAGQSISPDYIADMIEYLEGKDWSVNVISKSGTTTETSITFRIFRDLLYKKYGRDASGRIYATTDRSRGALKQLALTEGYESFVVPDDLGGRYSVLSAVGLLPIAAAGIDTDALLEGARTMREIAGNDDFSLNGPVQYAMLRNLFYRKGKKIELLALESPSLRFLGQWFVQLFAESEGKDHKGIFPSCMELSADLHSVGQYLQDGERTLLETVVNVTEPRRDVAVPAGDAADGIAYLEGKTLGEVSRTVIEGAVLAHHDGGVPVMRLQIPERTAYYLGQVFYFFEYACGISGYMEAVNPFNQPGVEDYKRNMFALLGKPGYEELGETLRERLK